MSGAGLEGIVAAQTAICTVGKEGHSLNYRGYSIRDLCEQGSFEETAYLLIYGHLPNATQLAQYQQRLISLRSVPQSLLEILERIPATAHPMDVLRTATSFLGTIEPEEQEHDQYHISDRLIAIMPSLLCYWYHFQKNKKRIDFQAKEKSIAGYFLELLHQKTPAELQRRAIDVSLILYAEHELNASTFAARVTSATLSDFYSAITSAIGTLRGPLHGGANEAAMELIERFSSVEAADHELRAMLGRKERIMGFGHRVYKISDPRSDIIKQWAQKLSKHVGDQLLFAVSEVIERVMWEEKKLFPNLDFYSASAYHFCDIPTDFFTPMFVFARLSGWSAHIMEQRSKNRLIRPTAEYTGPEPTHYIPIDQRS